MNDIHKLILNNFKIKPVILYLRVSISTGSHFWGAYTETENGKRC